MFNKIFRIKPLVFLIIFFVFQILAFLISAAIISMFDISSFSLNVPIFFTFNITPILLWYLYTGYALFLKDKKKNSKKKFIIFQLSVLLIFISIIFSLIIELYKSSINIEIRIPIIIIIGILEIPSIIYIVFYWVKGFVRNYDKRTETKSDYLNYVYLICIPPIGIYVIQKLINTITENEVKNKNCTLG